MLTVDVKIPMLGMIKRKAEKVIIDRALAGLKKRVESGKSPIGRAARVAAPAYLPGPDLEVYRSPPCAPS